MLKNFISKQKPEGILHQKKTLHNILKLNMSCKILIDVNHVNILFTKFYSQPIQFNSTFIVSAAICAGHTQKLNSVSLLSLVQNSNKHEVKYKVKLYRNKNIYV